MKILIFLYFKDVNKFEGFTDYKKDTMTLLLLAWIF